MTGRRRRPRHPAIAAAAVAAAGLLVAVSPAPATPAAFATSAVFATPATTAAFATTAAPVRHNTHIAYTRMVVEGTIVVARVRMFRDDLQKALKRPLTEDSAARAAVGTYVGRSMIVTANGTRLAAELVDSGGDTDGDQPIWWVLVQWKSVQPVTSLGLRVHVLFDTFNDQQNVVVVNRQPGDERRSLYFQPGDRTEQVVKF